MMNGTKVMGSMVILLLGLNLWAQTAQGTSPDALNIANQLKQTLQSIDAIKLDFDHQVYTPLRKKTRSYSGTAYFAKPNRFKWVREKPIEEIMIWNGKDLYIYQPQQKIAQKFSALGSKAREFEKLTSLVLHPEQLLQTHKLISFKEDKKKKILWLTLKPSSSSDIDQIDIKVSFLRRYVKEVNINYTSGVKTNFIFKRPQHFVPDKGFFDFIPPKGVQIEVFD